MKTKYDDLTVRELEGRFDEEFIRNDLDKKASEYFNDFTRFKGGFVGASPSQLISYWRNYEDHIRRYNDKITAYRAGIMYDLEVLNQLIKYRDEVAAQKKMFDKIDIDWWPMKDNPEYSRRCYDAVKEHEIKYHLDNLLFEYDPNIDRPRKLSSRPVYELICDTNGKLKHLRCKCCYEKKILSKTELFKFEYEDMDLDAEPGGGR